MIFQAVFAICCKALLLSVQLPLRSVIQLDKMLSKVPLSGVMGGGALACYRVRRNGRHCWAFMPSNVFVVQERICSLYSLCCCLHSITINVMNFTRWLVL